MRRLVLLFAALGTAMAILGLMLQGAELLNENQQAAAQSAPHPNIIFVMTDDQAESTLSHMPNVQSLKTKGLTFTNAFNVYPLCCPSRAIIQRGQYAHNTQVFGNGSANYGSNGGYPAFDRQDLEKSTVATWLDAAGYRTMHFGKYMNNFDPKVNPPPPGWDVFGTPTVPYQVGETKNATTANRAMAQLRQDAPNVEPVFLQVGFDAPHVPNEYESQDATKFVGEQVPRVPSFDEQDVTDKPRYIREDKPPLSQQTNPDVHTLCQDNETNSIQQNDCEYVRQLRDLQTVDRFIKDVTDYLASQGELSNTYIVYYTDNGNHWGEHRLDFGKLTPYETDTNFPLLIRGPGIPENATTSKLIGNHDIAPTFAEIAGASTPSFVDGRSFLRIADADPNNDSPWRTGLYVERRYKPEWTLPPKDDSGQYVPPYEGVREESLIYVHYQDDPWTAVNDAGFREFYDLSTDPYELRNLAYYGEVPQATLDRLEGRLLRLRGCKAEACRAAEDESTTNPTTPTDRDGDGVADPDDNCPDIFNTDQADADGDGVGDACEATPPPETAPTVTGTVPAADAKTVGRTTNVTATFSEDMMTSSINGTTFKLTKKGSTTKISATVSYDPTTRTATLNPFGSTTTRLARGTTYKAVVTTGAKDLAGNSLDQDQSLASLQQKTWFFTTTT